MVAYPIHCVARRVGKKFTTYTANDLAFIFSSAVGMVKIYRAGVKVVLQPYIHSDPSASFVSPVRCAALERNYGNTREKIQFSDSLVQDLKLRGAGEAYYTIYTLYMDAVIMTSENAEWYKARGGLYSNKMASPCAVDSRLEREDALMEEWVPGPGKTESAGAIRGEAQDLLGECHRQRQAIRDGDLLRPSIEKAPEAPLSPCVFMRCPTLQIRLGSVHAVLHFWIFF